jgi:hypothetical protein
MEQQPEKQTTHEVSPARLYFLINHLTGMVEKLRDKQGSEANVTFYEDIIACLKKLSAADTMLTREKINHQLTKELYVFMLDRLSTMEQRLARYEAADQMNLSMVMDDTYKKLTLLLNTTERTDA